MANSYRPGSKNPPYGICRIPPRTCGPLGINDQGDPNITTLFGDTPGPLGLNDYADPSLGFFYFNREPRICMPTRAEDGTLLSPGLKSGEDKSGKAEVSADGGQINLPTAQEMALKITTVFEGGKSMNYAALADDFDGQTTSFGLIQWNFGQNTLGPLLNKMLLQDSAAFGKCFGADANYETFKKALTEGNQASQIKWARDLQKSNRSAWSAAFRAIGSVVSFNRIQKEEAASNYHPSVVKAISSLRSLDGELMKLIEFRSYAALFDLCVQQHGIEKAWEAIKVRVKTDKPTTQMALMMIAVVERAKKASSQWVSDCTRRRMGILNGEAYESKANPQLSLIKASGNKIVAGL